MATKKSSITKIEVFPNTIERNQFCSTSDAFQLYTARVMLECHGCMSYYVTIRCSPDGFEADVDVVKLSSERIKDLTTINTFLRKHFATQRMGCSYYSLERQYQIDGFLSLLRDIDATFTTWGNEALTAKRDAWRAIEDETRDTCIARRLSEIEESKRKAAAS